jgi:hypothetical protein
MSKYVLRSRWNPSIWTELLEQFETAAFVWIQHIVSVVLTGHLGRRNYLVTQDQSVSESN